MAADASAAIDTVQVTATGSGQSGKKNVSSPNLLHFRDPGRKQTPGNFSFHVLLAQPLLVAFRLR